jgi:hypothetical protein
MERGVTGKQNRRAAAAAKGATGQLYRLFEFSMENSWTSMLLNMMSGLY